MENKVRDVKLPEIFDSFADARKDGFLAMKKLKDEGKGVVGTFCTYTPNEIFKAADLIPVGLCSTSDETIPEAEKTLPRNLCPLIKSSYGFAVTDKCPYMYFSDLVVGETTCDGKKKMYELLGEIKDVHIMELPQKQDGELDFQLWRAEIVKLKERVEEKFDVEITDEKLKTAIKNENNERKALREFYNLSRLTPPPMTGMDQIKLLFGSQFKFGSSDEKIAEVHNAMDKIMEAYNAGERPVPESAKRIVITGCPLGGVTEKLVRVIEESGGVVVAYENCSGIKKYENLVDETIDPYDALARRYLDIGCSVMTPNPHRFTSLETICRDFKADGVIDMTLQACHTFAIETYNVREFLRQLGVPYLAVETDYSLGDVEQLKTRCAAFIEML